MNMYRNTVAVETRLHDIAEGLRRAGFSVTQLNSTTHPPFSPFNVNAVVIDGRDGQSRQYLNAAVPVVQVGGLLPQQAVDEVIRKIEVIGTS